MSEELTMPRLSDTMEEGRIGRWLKREGDSFREGDVIAEIETDKATMEFQAYDDGTVLRIIVDDGETAALGAPIAIVGEAGETVEAPAEEAAEPAEAPRPETPAPDANVSAETAPPQGNGEDRGAAREPDRPPHGRRRRARPADAGRAGKRPRRPDREGRRRARARRNGAPATDVPGQPFHRHRRAGRETAVPGTAVSAPGEGDEVRELSPMLKAVARRMGESKATVPHFYVSVRDRHDPGPGAAEGAERGARRLGREGVA